VSKHHGRGDGQPSGSTGRAAGGGHGTLWRGAKSLLNPAISEVFGEAFSQRRIDSQAAIALKNASIRAAWPPGLFFDTSGLPSAAFEDSGLTHEGP
jgi:hypothetical protein